MVLNARSGYRAHYRASVRQKCDQLLQVVVSGRDLDGQFEDCGPVEIQKTFLLASLVPRLSKVWVCTKRIRPFGGVDDCH